MGADFEGYDEQAGFDAASAGTGIDRSGYGPDGEALEGALGERRVRVEGLRLVPAHPGAGVPRTRCRRCPKRSAPPRDGSRTPRTSPTSRLFVPWSRHADNSIDNLVAAHDDCNGRKSDFLAAAEHVERWRERSARHAATLAQIARSETWESRPDRTFGVARAIYRMLPDDARLWRSGQDFIVLERPRLVAALAA